MTPTHAEGLLALADACENAEGARFVLDRDIALAVYPRAKPVVGNDARVSVWDGNGWTQLTVKPFTASLDAGKPAEGEEEADMGMLSGCMEFSERPAKKASTSTDDDGLAVAVEAEAQFLVDRIDEMDWSLDAEDFVREWNGHVDPPLCRLRSTLKARKGDAA